MQVFLDISRNYMTIKLIKSTFLDEKKTKNELCQFIQNTEKLSMGEQCEKFEAEIAKFQGSEYSVSFNSGSSANLALIQSCLNLGLIHKNDSVGFSSLTWSTNVMPLIQLGLNPIAIDVEIESLNISPAKLEDSILKSNIKCLFITNLLGFCDQLEQIKSICERNNILLLEDNCESFGSQHNGVKLGNFGLGASFSFFVGHHLSAIEGGAVTTSSEELYEMLKMVRAHGWSRNSSQEKANQLKEKNNISDFYNMYTFYDLGYNLRPTEITGFVGTKQMVFANETVSVREKNYKAMFEASLRNEDIIHLNIKDMDIISNFAFPIVFKTGKVEKYIKKFQSHNVEIRPIVGGDMTQQPFFKKYFPEYQVNLDSNASFIHHNGFYVPNNPELTDSEIKTLSELISNAI